MKERWNSSILYVFCAFWVRVCLTLYNRMAVRGAEHVPRHGGALVVSNHASYLDPPVLGSSIFKRPMSFMARDSLFKNPIARVVFSALKARPMDRERGDVGALRLALSLVRAGELVALFPEGTRTIDGELQPPKGGIGFLVAKAKAPVIPAYIDGTFKAWPKGARWWRPARIRIRFGPPIAPERFEALGSGKEAYRKAGELIMDEIKKLRS